MKIAIGADHAGYTLKEHLKQYLRDKGHEIHDFGTNSEERADYPDFAHPLAEDIQVKKADFGILMCGSGNGINMTANKHRGIRSALCWLPEIAQLAREHNNANVLTLPARYISKEEAEKIVEAFLSADFEGGRHERRVEKISDYDFSC